MSSYLFILPVYNEELILERSATQLLKSLEVFYSDFKLVIANNGSTDYTGKIADKLAQEHENIVHFNITKKGRGNAIKETVKKYKADTYAYFDIDLPFHLEIIPEITQRMEKDSIDLVVVRRRGSRPFLRKLLTWGMLQLSGLFLGLEYSDPQSGIKFFNASLASLIQSCREDTYFLDTEMIKLAQTSNCKILEYEAEWIDLRYIDRKTKVNPIKDTLSALRALVRIDRRYDNNLRSVLIEGIVFSLYLALLITLVLKYSLFGPIYGPPFDLPPLTLQYLLLAFCLFTIALGFVVRQHKKIFSFIILPFVLTLFTKPLFSQDCYWNMLLAKAFLLEHKNPFVTTPQQLSYYSIYHYLHSWQGLSMTHGPVSVFFYALPYIFTKSDVAAVLVLRLMAIAIMLVTVFALKKLQSTKSPWTLFLTSPFVLVLGVLDLHNDILVMLFITLSYYHLVEKKYTYSFVWLLLGFLTKYITLILLPIPVIAILKSDKVPKEKFVGVFKLTSIAIVLLVLCYLPFKSNLAALASGAKYQTTLTSPSQMTFITYFLIQYVVKNLYLLKLLGFLIGFFLAVLLAFKRKYLEAYTLPILAVLLFATNWIMSWYFLWILPLLLLYNKKRLVIIYSGLLLLATYGLFNIFLISALSIPLLYWDRILNKTKRIFLV